MTLTDLEIRTKRTRLKVSERLRGLSTRGGDTFGTLALTCGNRVEWPEQLHRESEAPEGIRAGRR